eukprot:434620-Prorocentrum_minimum.AAC.1
MRCPGLPQSKHRKITKSGERAAATVSKAASPCASAPLDRLMYPLVLDPTPTCRFRTSWPKGVSPPNEPVGWSEAGGRCDWLV